jgi:predicted Holliday junction resolvase-like endonuclease
MQQQIDPGAVVVLVVVAFFVVCVACAITELWEALENRAKKKDEAVRRAHEELMERLKLKRERLRRKPDIEVIEEDET